MSKVFISYSRQSGAVAAGLAGDIEALGHTVWLDKELSGGQSWWDRILSTIRECDVFVFVLDSQSLDSTACKRECSYAADIGKSIVPVLTADGISTNLLPSMLSQIQFVDYRSRDRDAVLRLARAFTSLPPARPLPSPLPPVPDVPLSYLGSLGERVDKASTLNYEEQSALIVDLKRSMRDPEARDDARTLIYRLRKRRDLLAAVADEIDEVLGSSKSATQSPHVVREPVPPAQDHPRLSEARAPSPGIDVDERRVSNQGPERVATGSRVKSAGLGAFAGTVLVAFAISAERGYLRSDMLLTAVVLGGIPWALAGAVAAMRPRVIRIAFATAAVGFVIVWIGFTIAREREAFSLGIVFGAGGGQLLGALAGARGTRKRRSDVVLR